MTGVGTAPDRTDQAVTPGETDRVRCADGTQGRRASSAPVEAVSAVSAAGSATDPWETLRFARDIGRPTALGLVDGMYDEFVEPLGDRTHAGAPAIVGGIADLDGTTVMPAGYRNVRADPGRAGAPTPRAVPPAGGDRR